MQTDRELLKELFTKRNIKFEENDHCITIEAGYVGFFSDFTFDDNGTLLKVEAFE